MLLATKSNHKKDIKSRSRYDATFLGFQPKLLGQGLQVDLQVHCLGQDWQWLFAVQQQ